MCLFIHYPVSDRNTIICVLELVILNLITLGNEGKKQCLPNDRASPRQRGTKHFSYDFYTCTDPFHSELTEEHNENRIVGQVFGL